VCRGRKGGGGGRRKYEGKRQEEEVLDGPAMSDGSDEEWGGKGDESDGSVSSGGVLEVCGGEGKDGMKVDLN